MQLSLNGCGITPGKNNDERRLIMKAKRTIKTLKAAAAATGVAAVLLLPTGCASAAGGTGIGTGACVVDALGVCV
jgi:hypothetical protein